jgi:ADP-ribose pyrophosphatase YjhB (NUDIX family)
MLKTFIAVKALIKKDNQFLVLKNIDNNQWETPGGRLEDKEDLINGLNREVKEETNLEVNILFPFHTHSANLDKDNPIIGITYLCEYVSGEITLDQTEQSEYKWLTLEEIKELKDSVGIQYEIGSYERVIKLIKNI